MTSDTGTRTESAKGPFAIRLLKVALSVGPPLGLLGINGPALSDLRKAFGGNIFEGPGCVTYHPFGPAGSGNCVIQNFNNKAVNVTVSVNIEKDKSNKFVEAFSGKPIDVHSTESGNQMALNMPIPARGRIWIGSVD